jgi:RNA polymerase sigma-70 factor (ECF subfamily)
MDLETTIERAGAGDPAAWEALIRDGASLLHAAAVAITRDAALAEDVVQECFLRVLQGRCPSLRPGTGKAFLLRVTASTAIDALRRRTARRRREEEYMRSRGEATPGPENPILAAETSRAAAEALSMLPTETRAALWLHVVEDQGIREVARALGCTRWKAARRIDDGKRRLRRLLAGRGAGVIATAAFPEVLRGSAPHVAPRALIEALIRSRRGSTTMPSGAPRKVNVAASSRVPALACAVTLLAIAGSLLGWRLRERAPDLEVETIPRRAATRPSPSRTGSRRPPPRGEAGVVTTDTPGEGVALRRLRGIVVDAESRGPVPGAKVRPLTRRREAEVRGEVLEATSGPGGEFELALAADNDCRFFAEADGYCRTTFHPAREDWTQVAELIPRLEVTGRVLAEDGAPLEGAVVEVRGVSEGGKTTYLSEPQEERAVSAADGGFTISPLKFGQPRLAVFKEGYGGVIILGVAPGAHRMIVRVPRGVAVSGRAISGGNPATAVRISWVTGSPDNTGWKGETITDPEGRFSFAGLPAPGIHFLGLLEASRGGEMENLQRRGRDDLVHRLVVKPGEIIEDLVLDWGAHRAWQEEEAAKRLAVGAGTNSTPARPGARQRIGVRGRVHDPAGDPIARARLGATFELGGGRYLSTALSRADGSFECGNHTVEPGTYQVQLEVNHPAWGPEFFRLDPIVVPEGVPGDDQEAVAGPVDIELSHGFAARGTVTDPRGLPLEGVLILSDERALAGGAPFRLLDRTRSQGSFVLGPLNPEHDLRLLLFHQDFVPLELPGWFNRGTVPRSGEDLDLGRLVLRPGGIVAGMVFHPDGSPFAHGRVTVEDRVLQPPALTDPDGNFVLDHVAPGRHRLIVFHDDARLTETGLPLDSGPTEVTVADGAKSYLILRLAGK